MLIINCTLSLYLVLHMITVNKFSANCVDPTNLGSLATGQGIDLLTGNNVTQSSVLLLGRATDVKRRNR